MKLWPRFVRTPAEVIHDWLDAIGAVVALALIFDLCHGPQECDSTWCPYDGKKNRRELLGQSDCEPPSRP